MRWQDMRRSDNVEEASGGGSPGMGGGMRLGGGAIVEVVVISLLLGRNPLELLALMGGDGGAPSAPSQTTPYTPPSGAAPTPRDEQKEFVAKILGDTEDVWGSVFQQAGTRYQPPKLVVFNGQVGSACGLASAAVGPFYCPGDHKLYLDTAFFDELARRFKAPGDFAQAYVIAHEVGHHVQNLTGVMQQVDARRARLDERGNNALSIRLELQADCYAGVWGYFAQKRGKLDPGDIEEGLAAASAVGDDQIQKRTQGYVAPDSFTHGTAAQRSSWFKTGLASGDMRKCDTFATRDP